jgi:signal transduction histidine kinase
MNALTLETATQRPEKFDESKTNTADLLTEAIKETRRISHELMPTLLAEFGLSAAIKDVCDQLRDGSRFECTVSLGAVKLDNYVELAIFRTVQELMVNVVRHADATNTKVNVIANGDEVLVLVRDNERGMENGIGEKPGIGLSSIRTKVELLKGSLDIQSGPGKGTTVKVRLPLQFAREN